MVGSLLRWPSWPPSGKKFDVIVAVKKFIGFDHESLDACSSSSLVVEIKWRGQKGIILSRFKKTTERDLTDEATLCDGGIYSWNELFLKNCNLTLNKDGAFAPWEIALTVFCKQTQEKLQIIGTSILNLAEFASSAIQSELDISLPFNIQLKNNTHKPTLLVGLKLEELRMQLPLQETFERGEENKPDIQWTTDSSDDESSDDHLMRYKLLAHAKTYYGSVSLHDVVGSEGGIYCSNKYCDQSLHVDQCSKSWIFPWPRISLRFIRKRDRRRSEPLLKKGLREDGGDDIDHARRMLSSDEFGFDWSVDSGTSSMSCSDFGDVFEVGSWETKEIASRDNGVKLKTKVFFAAIDQRHESAAGESACTALVAVIASWLHANKCQMPIKSEFNSLIKEGSSEWRTLCDVEEYRQRFPDRHFDLETIIDAGIRPLALNPDKSFVGFFNPGYLEGEEFEFLNDAMSFDTIWEQITSLDHEGETVYVVSWNDHFFILKIDGDAFYIIDTLGERLYEGCKQAYFLKFDKESEMKAIVKKEVQEVKGKKKKSESKSQKVEEKGEVMEEVVCKGKETCKEYIKKFLSSVPLRELQEEVKKGIKSSTPHHHRLQIEFHYTLPIHKEDKGLYMFLK